MFYCHTLHIVAPEVFILITQISRMYVYEHPATSFRPQYTCPYRRKIALRMGHFLSDWSDFLTESQGTLEEYLTRVKSGENENFP